MPSDKVAEKARRFLSIADQFQLGNLVTESSHERTRDLSGIARKDISAGLDTLFGVDEDVVRRFREWARSGEGARIARSVSERIACGGKVFFAGCGATGRLSIQLTAMWRDYWQKRRVDGEFSVALAEDFERRAFSVMAGGDFALIKSVEGFEDYAPFGRRQIDELGAGKGDTVFAITEGGETSFVIGAAWQGLENGADVFFVYNNPDDLLCAHVARSREIIQEPAIRKINLTSGPMAITGSTRMQATSIQLCVMATLLEMIIKELSGCLDKNAVAGQELEAIPLMFLKELDEMLEILRDEPVRRQLSVLVEREETIYRGRHRNNYFADQLALDVLTDTTERSPTFCIPAFKKFDDGTAAESWSFLFLPCESTEEAWRRLLRRDIQPVEWDRETIRQLIGEDDLDRQDRIMRTIGHEEILRFRIGLDGISCREIRPGDGATAILTEDEMDELAEPGGFYRSQLERADARGGVTAVVFLGSQDSIRRMDAALDSWHVPALRVFIPAPDSSLVLRGSLRVGVKMLLNALSTITMVRLGRVMGNVMIWVAPGNLKLIDRAIRYIRLFTGLGYEDACHLLHGAIDYVLPRMSTGKEYPSTVGLCLIAHRDKCDFEEAEEKLLRELSGASGA